MGKDAGSSKPRNGFKRLAGRGDDANDSDVSIQERARLQQSSNEPTVSGYQCWDGMLDLVFFPNFFFFSLSLLRKSQLICHLRVGLRWRAVPRDFQDPIQFASLLEGEERVGREKRSYLSPKACEVGVVGP